MNYLKKQDSLLNLQNSRVNYTKWEDHSKPWREYPKPRMHTSSELHYLYDTPMRLGEGNYANIGTYKGESAATLALGLKEIKANNSKVFAVDTFEQTEEYKIPSNIEEIIYNNFKTLGINQYLHLRRGLSSDWAKKLNKIKFQFVFIDADHSYESVVEDFKLWSPLVVENGEIAFHDTHYESVDTAIKKFVLRKWKQIDHYYSLKSFRRK